MEPTAPNTEASAANPKTVLPIYFLDVSGGEHVIIEGMRYSTVISQGVVDETGAVHDFTLKPERLPDGSITIRVTLDKVTSALDLEAQTEAAILATSLPDYPNYRPQVIEYLKSDRPELWAAMQKFMAPAEAA